MNIRKVQSSNVYAVGYKNGVLVIGFQSGSVYVYRGARPWMYALFFRANSVGKMFWRFIRTDDTISFVRVL